MQHPTKKQLQLVIDRFKKVLPHAQEDFQLDMGECGVRPEFAECKTIHCVGGWYSLACINREKFQLLMAGNDYWDYSYGADAMAKDLGFSCCGKLAMWAEENPALWGNQHGGSMFGSECAYGMAKNLNDIIVWLEKIIPRLPA